jgi:hypothetical protein
VARSVDRRLENLERLVVHGETVGAPSAHGQGRVLRRAALDYLSSQQRREVRF